MVTVVLESAMLKKMIIKQQKTIMKSCKIHYNLRLNKNKYPVIVFYITVYKLYICVRDWENEATGGKITFSDFYISA